MRVWLPIDTSLGLNGLIDSLTRALDQAFVPNATLCGHRPRRTPHTLTLLESIKQVPIASRGVSMFGEFADLTDVHRHHDIDTESIVRAALDVAK